jgi:hypothetical protein
MTYLCQYCKKDFQKETSLAVHLCEPKRRMQERNERGVELGFQAYLRFYEMTQGSAKLKTYEPLPDLRRRKRVDANGLKTRRSKAFNRNTPRLDV